MLNAIIRDDDLNVTSSPNDIDKAYHGILDIVPVNFFLIPHLAPPEATIPIERADHYWHSMILNNPSGPIWDNSELLSYLACAKEKKIIDLGFHGIHHYYHELEKSTLSRSDVEYHLNKFIENFGTKPTSISFPNNSCSRENASLLADYFENFFIGYSHKLFERKLGVDNFLFYARAAFNAIIHQKGIHIAAGPNKINNVKEYSSLPISYISKKESIISDVEYFTNKETGVICLATHFYDLRDNSKTRSLLREVIDLLQSAGVTFSLLSDLA